MGRQVHCGYDNTGFICPGGTKAHDSASCSATTLFGSDPNDWYGCRRDAGEGSSCHFVVVEGAGPNEGDVWCRVSPIVNNGAHHCKDDPTQFCHVITVRAGRGTGTYLRVDENEPDRNIKSLPAEQSGLFGGGRPTIDAAYVVEVRSRPTANGGLFSL